MDASKDPAPSLEELGEFGLIGRLASILGPASGAVEVGIGDDCAVVRVGGERLLLAQDSMVEGVHFVALGAVDHPLHDLHSVGWRLAVSNLSDVAAMGGDPVAATVSVAAPDGCPPDALEAIYAGLRAASEAFGLPVCGGDVVRTAGPLALSLAIVGRADGEPATRSGARPGDVLCVTGRIGAARTALAIAEAGGRPPEDLVRRHLHPTPRLAEGRILRERGATAMIDLSDGLWGDAGRLAEASGVGLRIDIDALPLSETTLSAWPDARTARREALRGGEDYELLVAVPAERLVEIAEALRPLAGLTAVGNVVEGSPGARWVHPESESLAEAVGSWDHFARRSEDLRD